MNARTEVKLGKDERETLQLTLRSARDAISRLLLSASMVRDGALQPNWEHDILDPRMDLNLALSHIESTLELDHVAERTPVEPPANKA